MRGHSLIDLFTRFARLGAEWVMWLLVALSFLSITLIIERVRTYRALRDDLSALRLKLIEALSASDNTKAKAALLRSPSPAARVAYAGLEVSHRGPTAMQHAMNAALTQQKKALEKNLTPINTIGSNAPFVGLFGTVLGIVQAFDAMKPPTNLKGAAAAAAASQANAQVMGTIAEALTATAIGLLVAIPAVSAFNAFQRKIKSMLGESEILSETLLTFAHEPTVTAVTTSTHEPIVTAHPHRTSGLHALATGAA